MLIVTGSPSVQYSVRQYHSKLPRGSFRVQMLHKGEVLSALVPYDASRRTFQLAMQSLTPDVIVSVVVV